MPLPGVKISVNPKGITVIPSSGGNVPLLLGSAVGAQFGQLVAYSSLPTIASNLLDGQLADAAALCLSYGASQVLTWQMFSGSIDTSPYSASGSKQIANVGGATPGSGTISFQGTVPGLTPVVRILTSSSATSYGTFDYSLDGGNSWTGVATSFTSAMSYPLGASGVTAILSKSGETTGYWVAGDQYACRGMQAAVLAGTGTVTFSGSPVAPYGAEVGGSGIWNGVIVQITTSSSASVAGQFNYSLDGGATWSASQEIPTSLVYVIPGTGLSVTFSAQLGSGVWNSGDSFRSPITGFVGAAWPLGGTAFNLLQVGLSGSQASAKGAGTFGPGEMIAVDGVTYSSGAYGNAGSGAVRFFGAIGATTPLVKITTASTTGSANGDFAYSTDGGATWSAPIAIGAPTLGVSAPIALGTTGIWAVFSGTQSGSFYETGVFEVGDIYGVALSSPADEYNVLITITASGSVESNSCEYVVSFDGGLTFGPTQIMTGPVINLGHGVTVTAFDAGGSGATAGFQAGDTYSFSTQPPQFTTTDVGNVLSILQGNAATWGWVHVLGHSATVAAMGATADELNTMMGLWWTAHRFGVWAILDAPPDTDQHNIDAALIGANSAGWVGNDVVSIGAGDAAVISPLTGFQLSRAASWLATARACKAPLGQDLGYVGAGALTGVTQLFRDENATPGLDSAGFITLRTFSGISGFFITNGNVFANAGDDINLAQYRRVIDAAAASAYAALVQYVNASVRTIAGGTIDPRDAKAINGVVGTALMISLAGQISGLTVAVDLTHNILADGVMPVTISIQPLGYSKQIDVTLGFSNDALSALSVGS